MFFKTDIVLRHSNWKDGMLLLVQDGQGIFKRYVDLFIIACSLGVAEDKRIADDQTNEQSIYSIPRNTLNTNSDVNSCMEFIFQNAILNTKTVDFDMDKRKELAFNIEYTEQDFNINKFLAEFANYGISIICNAIDKHPIVTLENLESLIDKYTNCIVPPSEMDDLDIDIV